MLTAYLQEHFEIFNKSFTHESHLIKYNIFVGSVFPRGCTGNIGDICVNSTRLDEVTTILNATKGNRKIEMPENHNKHRIYFKGDKGWTCADGRRDDNGRPLTAHPTTPAAIVLDDYAFRWRNVRSYYCSNDTMKKRKRGETESTPGIC